MARRKSSLPALAAALTCALAAFPVHAETFTYGSGAPERANFHARGVKPMMQAITKATDGRVQFRGLYGGTVVRLDTTLQGIRDGVVDAGYLIVAFHPAELPHAGMLGEMSALSDDPFAAAGAVSEILYKHCAECRKEFAKQGQEAVFTWATSPMSMVCTGNVKSAADLANKRVSVISSSESRWASALGMSPTRTAISDLASSLQLGRSDCAIIPINWIRSYGLVDIAKSVIALPQGIAAGAVPLAISSKAWAKISDADKAAIRNAIADNMYSWVKDAYLAADEEVRDQTKSKITYIDSDPAMAKAWKEHQAKEVDALIELAKRRNIPNAEQFVKDAAKVFRKWHEVHLPAFKNDPKAYGEIVKREVFAQ